MSTTSIRLPFLQGDFLSRVGRKVTTAVRDEQDLALMIVQAHDVERICASIGHEEARNLLDDFFLRLKGVARDNDLVERIEDRKFAVLLNGLRNVGHVNLAAQKIHRLAAEAADAHGGGPELTATIGISLCPTHGTDAPELMRLAEIASLHGRRNNDSVCFFEYDAAQQLFSDWGMEQRLQLAIQSGDLQLYYQPKIGIESGAVLGMEALMRWHEPEIGSISPDVFIALAEATGQITELTQFSIQSACRQISDWSDEFGDLQVAVNVTPTIIQDREIIDIVQSATSIWGIDPSRLTLEVTENALMEDRQASHEVLTELRRIGLKISIDDFGTGYSSLAYLKEIPADEIKIDRSFVMGMLDNSGDLNIVKHTINIARSFDLSVVAEGVESEAMLGVLRDLGCDHAQGFFICRPVPPGEFEEFLRDHQDTDEFAV